MSFKAPRLSECNSECIPDEMVIGNEYQLLVRGGDCGAIGGECSDDKVVNFVLPIPFRPKFTI